MSGDVFRLKNWTHHFVFKDRRGSVGYKVADKSTVAVMVCLGYEAADGSSPLNIDEVMSQLGWARKPEEPSEQQPVHSEGRGEVGEEPR